MKKWFGFVLVGGLLLLPRLCGAEGSKFILLSSTIGPIDSGVVDLLENEFEKETGIRVRHMGAGTGAALEIAKKGNVDLVMVHAKSLEEKFVQEGFGMERIGLMYNDFVIVGPAKDPAGIKGMKSAQEALKRISEKEVVFVTRGDRSGTHVAEMELWQKAGIKPRGSWYYTCPRGAEGNVPTLRHTDKMEAYTFIDRATVLSMRKEIKLEVLVEKDEALLNFISLIPVNPQKFPKVNYTDTMKFVKWLTSPEKGQKIIADFGKDKYGSPLFFANSKEWREKQGLKK
jgi:tungstate transport system substrate-binding protein